MHWSKSAVVAYLYPRPVLTGLTLNANIVMATHMPPRLNIRVLRDIRVHQDVADNEISCRAYLYVTHDQSLPPQMRYQAQLQLNTFGYYMQPTMVKNRCMATGWGCGVIGKFGLCQVCTELNFIR